MADAEAKAAALDELIKILARAVVEEAEKEAPPDLTPAKPHRERLNIGQCKTKVRRDQSYSHGR